MSSSMFCLKWDSYHKEIGSGFAQLQHSAEFVDMTLAAEGHLVKVHKNLIALASPYLKEMICSAPCMHPIVYLYNISHKILCYLLEYIYTGEVQIPSDMLTPFLDASKALCIVGAKDLVSTQPLTVWSEPEANQNNNDNNNDRPENFAAHITINSDNYNLEVQPLGSSFNAKKVVNCDAMIENMPLLFLPNGEQAFQGGKNHNITLEKDNYVTDICVIPNETNQVNAVTSDDKQTTKNSSEADNAGRLAQTEICTVSEKNMNEPCPQYNIEPLDLNTPDEIDGNESLVPTHPTVFASSIITKGKEIGIVKQYSVSNRGAIQLILNRFIYYCHHQSFGDRKRRWRCIDYRKLHCPAYIDTDGDDITSRKGIHCHTYHDNKIMKKSKQMKLYASIPKATKSTTKNKFNR